jgi:transcriptional regulator with XRE-family HTH domain
VRTVPRRAGKVRYRGADPNLSRVASKIGHLRLARGLTQDAVARQAGMGKRTVERYDRGEVKNPPIRQLLAFAQVLDCSLEDIVEDHWRLRRRG